MKSTIIGQQTDNKILRLVTDLLAVLLGPELGRRRPVQVLAPAIAAVEKRRRRRRREDVFAAVGPRRRRTHRR